MLDEHPNLTIDISWTLHDDVVGLVGVSERWVELIEARADRFVLGSDLAGDTAELPPRIVRFLPLIADHPPPCHLGERRPTLVRVNGDHSASEPQPPRARVHAWAFPVDSRCRAAEQSQS